MAALRRHTLAFDIPFLSVLPWWRSVFHTALRAAQASVLQRSTPRMSNASEPGFDEDQEAGADVTSDADADETGQRSDSDASSEGSGSSPSSTSRSGSTQSPSRPLVRMTTATESTRLAARLRAKMLLPVHDFCAALLRSTAWWFDAPHCTVLISLFHTCWGTGGMRSGSRARPEPEAELICELLCRKESLLHLPVLLPDHSGTSVGQDNQANLPATASPGASPDANDSARQHRLAVQLDSADMESLAWLEGRCPALAGVAAAAKADPAAFFCKARAGLLVEQLPMPFARLHPVHRALLALLLWPSEACATLAWLSKSSPGAAIAGSVHSVHGVPDTFLQLDGASRLASALQCIEEYRPVLLHAATAEPPASLLLRLMSVHARGALPTGAAAASSVLDALHAGSAAATLRACHTQLCVIHVSANMPPAGCSGVIADAASRGHWVLLSCAHLRPDICNACLAAAEALRQSDSLSPEFRLFLACPTAELPRMPLRYSLLAVNYGDDWSARPVALRLLRAVDSAAGLQLGLFDDALPASACSAGMALPNATLSQAVPARLPPHHCSALQQWTVRIAEVLAAVVERTCGVGACGVLARRGRRTVTDRDFMHVLHVIKGMIGRTEDAVSHAAGPADLHAAILQVLQSPPACATPSGQTGTLDCQLPQCHLGALVCCTCTVDAV